MLFDESIWIDFLNDNDIDAYQAKILTSYGNSLAKNNLPVIFEIEHLSSLLGLEVNYLYQVIHSPHSFYRVFYIKKKNGGEREILSPYPILSYIQKWIKNNILDKDEVSDYAFAYVKGKSILDNANSHIKNHDLLRIDIRNFFQNISHRDVEKVFINLGYTGKLSYHLSKICCYSSFLPQGACTSPILSNLVCRDMDKKVSKLSDDYNLKYTRYADDMYFSGKIFGSDFLAKVSEAINSYEFEINDNKTTLRQDGSRKIITGLCISGNKVRVPKRDRRAFRKESHYLLMNKEKVFQGRYGEIFPSVLDKLIGKGSYILKIEPDNKYVKNILPKLIDIKKELLSA